MSEEQGKNQGSKSADEGKIKDLPEKKLTSEQEGSVKGGARKAPAGDQVKSRDLLKGR